MEIVKKINPKDLKWNDGTYYKSDGIKAMFYPIIEMSCGKIKLIPEASYFYTKSLNFSENDKSIEIQKIIENNSKYECFKV